MEYSSLDWAGARKIPLLFLDVGFKTRRGHFNSLEKNELIRRAIPAFYNFMVNAHWNLLIGTIQ